MSITLQVDRQLLPSYTARHDIPNSPLNISLKFGTWALGSRKTSLQPQLKRGFDMRYYHFHGDTVSITSTYTPITSVVNGQWTMLNLSIDLYVDTLGPSLSLMVTLQQCFHRLQRMTMMRRIHSADFATKSGFQRTSRSIWLPPLLDGIPISKRLLISMVSR